MSATSCMDWCQFISLSVLHGSMCGTLLFPIKQWASLKCPDWRLTPSIRSTSCLAESVPRGLKMESSRATPCHLDRVDLGAGLSARTAECIKCCITTFKYGFQLLRIILNIYIYYIFFLSFSFRNSIFMWFSVLISHVTFSLYSFL